MIGYAPHRIASTIETQNVSSQIFGWIKNADSDNASPTPHDQWQGNTQR